MSTLPDHDAHLAAGDPGDPAPEYAGPLDEAFADTMAEQVAAGMHDEPPVVELPNLPAPLGTDGQLDLDRMRDALPQVRDGLVLALRHAARQHRAARGTVVTQEDTYPLVRRLTEADEVLGQWSRAFGEVAKEARALIEEEALTVAGAESDGMLSSSLFVPDGAGRRIAVRADYKAGSSTWDTATLVGWLIDDEAADDRCSCAAPGSPAYEGPERDCPVHGEPMTVARDVARNVVDRLLALGSYTPSAAKVKALRVKLAEQQRDADAAVIAQVRHVGERQYLGVKITREDAPAGGAA